MTLSELSAIGPAVSPDQEQPIKIGELVKSNVGRIFKHCESHPDELGRLTNADYSRRAFGLAWPFCMEADTISPKDHIRYWSSRYEVGDKRLRVCSQWFEKQRGQFCDYVSNMGYALTPGATTTPQPIPIPPKQNRRYGSIQIGDGQNAFIRFILSRLGEESFDERDWQETKAFFGNGCAYCDGGAAEQMDHGIPINRSKLGEHRLGNVIPACKKCNTEKHQRDYREHLRDHRERIDRIETYMANRGYTPLGDNDQVKAILEQAHKEVGALADRYIDILNRFLIQSPTESTG